MDWKLAATITGYALMGLLSFMGSLLWKDVRHIKDKWITKEDFQQYRSEQTEERDKKHEENKGNFRRLEERFLAVERSHHDSAIALEQRLGELLVKIAELRSYPTRADGPERRRL